MKGQVTVFMIIGLILVMIFGFAWWAVSTSGSTMPADQQMVHEFVLDCLDTVASDGLVVLGKQGRLSLDQFYEPLFLEYYYYNADLAPSNAMIERELANYVDGHLDICTDGFTGFKGLEFTYIGQPSTEVSIGKKDVSFGLKYDLVFSKPNVEFTLDEFRVEKEVRLYSLLDIARHLSDYYSRVNAIDTSYELPTDMTVHVHRHNSTMVVGLKDSIGLDNDPYVLSFAMN